MNKDQFIQKVAEGSGLSRAKAQAVLASLIKLATRHLKQGEKVALTGFGTFLMSKRGERQGRNPQTGEKMTIQATRVLRFRPGKEFKKKLNGKK